MADNFKFPDEDDKFDAAPEDKVDLQAAPEDDEAEIVIEDGIPIPIIGGIPKGRLVPIIGIFDG